ncbi:HD domain-containing protein [Pedobacter sp. KLB.chiD]|uniref:HD domain-containing protein n=1 Tax=Pedobacter sp. KLB.chiD TaxID=3387402 RepID=UPI00399B85F0
MNYYQLLLICVLAGYVILLTGKYFFKRRRKNIFSMLIGDVQAYVSYLFDEHWQTDLAYHDLDHTRLVVKRTREIASNFRLDDLQEFILFSAAWFHDTGQLTGPPAGHEQRSVKLMEEFLSEKGVDQEIISAIGHCIFSTSIPHSPKNILEEIICDADTYNLGNEEFLITDAKVASEMHKRGNEDLSNWDKKTLAFLSAHRFFTPYCKSKLSQGKQNNIDLVRERIKNKSD